jgi:DNA-binding transcriptional ArsR family regulator
MNEYNMRKLILSCPDLDANEKVLLFALCFRLDWNTWSGPVSVSNLSELTSSSERTVRRVISKLKEKGVISRVSTRDLGAAKSRVALTKINLSFFSKYDKVDTDRIDTVKVDTDKVDTVKYDKVDTVKHDNIDPHTISYNNKQYSINSLTTEEHAREALSWGDMEREEEIEENEREINQVYTFRYPSSIVDPKERMKAENHVKANYHRLTYSDRERIMFPDLTKPI